MNRLRISSRRKVLLPVLAGLLALVLVAAACGSDNPTQALGGNDTQPNGNDTQTSGLVGGVPNGNLQNSIASESRTDPAGLVSAFTPQVASNQQVGIWVNGVGQVTASPDIVTVSAGVEARAKTVAQARGQAAEAMDAMMQVLAGRGVEERDIRTTSFNIFPEFQYNRTTEKSELIGYRVNNQISVKVRDLDAVGVIIDELAEAGGDLTRINGITFGLDNPKALESQARELAVEDLLAKAQQYADLTGVGLGAPIFISESGGFSPRVSVAFDLRAAPAVEGFAVETPISGGELSVTITVQGVFGME